MSIIGISLIDFLGDPWGFCCFGSGSVQVCWALILILLVLYAFSIYAVTIVGNDAEPGSPLKKYFGDLRSSLLTGWQVTTFDHWGDVLTVSKSNLLMSLTLSIPQPCPICIHLPHVV